MLLAYSIIVKCFGFIQRSIYIKNQVGPSTEPYGSPHVMLALEGESFVLLFYVIVIILLVK